MFRDPASVAVVGASEDETKWGYWLARGALRGSHRRAVELVNRRAGTLFGRPCSVSITALDRAPELVALCVPAPMVAGVVEEGLALGVRGFLGITAGVPDECALAARVRDGGARLLGANSLGIFDAATELELAWGRFEAGPLAIVSQSGQLGSELAILGARVGLGISRFVSIGNQSDVSAAEVLADLAEHEPTRVIALYLESFTEAEELFGVLTALRATGKPTLLLTVGAGEASSRLARSHTGSLTSRTDVVDAACRMAGVARVRTPAELIDLARACLTGVGVRGHRVAVVGDSGGQGGVAADLADAVGLVVPAFPAGLHERLADALPEGAATGNPVDLAGAGERDLASYADTVEAVLADDTIDAAVLTGYFGRYAEDVPGLAEHERQIARQLGAVSHRHGKALVVHSMAEPGTSTAQLWSAGVPTFGDIGSSMRTLAGLAALRPRGTEPMPPLPEPEHEPVDGYWAAREALGKHGVRFPDGRQVRCRDDLLGTGLRMPLVLKAGWVAHKSEVGGVAVGITDTEALLAAFDRMYAALGPGEYVLEEQDRRPDVVEMLVGARRDPGFGPVVLVGAGGTEAEVWADTTVELAPLGSETATDMLDRLRCATLLAGWRGRPPVATQALAEVVSAVSRYVTANDWITELELNPVRVGTDGVLAVDALIIRRDQR